MAKTTCERCWLKADTKVYVDPDFGREYHFCLSCAYKAGLESREVWDAAIEEILAKYADIINTTEEV